MNRMTTCILFGICVAFSSPLFAACGGGGYAVQRNDRTAVRQDPTENADAFDFTRFDKISEKLNLSPRQSHDVLNMEAEMRRKFDPSQAHARAIDIKREFEQRLAQILNPDQMRAYYLGGG